MTRPSNPYARLYLAFRPAKAAAVLRLTADDEAGLVAALRGADREWLRRRACGVSTREVLVRLARDEGPMLLLSPTGEVERVEAGEPDALDRRAAEYDREYLELRMAHQAAGFESSVYYQMD